MIEFINTFRWYKPWFYKHVEKLLTEGEAEEYIPLRDGSDNNIIL